MTPKTERAEPQTIYGPSLLDKIIEQQASVASRYKPVMSTDEMIERERAIQYLVDNIMREGIDYGWIPGTRPKEEAKQGEYQAKPTLFKSGAERACAFFGYVPEYASEKIIEEWTADKYGEMLFYFSYRCTLAKDGKPVGSGLGSASTWESKYRYRQGQRTCPGCEKEGTIIKGRAEYGGGWLCFGKKGGCGAKYLDGDLAIEGQATEKVPNPDVADVVNTVQKMGQKRAYVAATLTATGLSGRFTQDLEDLPAPKEIAHTPQSEPTTIPNSSQPAAGRAPSPEVPRANGELEKWLAKMSGPKEWCEQFAIAKQILTKLTGSDIAYYAILDRFKVRHANGFKKLTEARACGTVLWHEAARIRAEIAATPAPAAPAEPAEVGDAYEPAGEVG